MPRCEAFNPSLPHSNAIEQAEWVYKWNTNLVSSQCLQSACAHACLPGNSPVSSGCLSCLSAASCNATLSCLNCIGGEGANTNDFKTLFNCTTDNPILTSGQIIAVIFASLIFFTLLITIVIFVLYKAGRLPATWKIWETNFLTNKSGQESYHSFTRPAIKI